MVPRTLARLKQRFVEEGLDVYHRPYDRDYPVVCMDESNKQLVGEVAEPVPAAPGHPKLVDDEYVRNGVAEIFMEVEPLAGRRHVEITERRTRIDWANQVRAMLEDRCPDAIKVVLVMDNLNTHSVASLYQAFAPDLARRLANRLEIHYTPKHGSWLNVAEIELSCLKRQSMQHTAMTRMSSKLCSRVRSTRGSVIVSRHSARLAGAGAQCGQIRAAGQGPATPAGHRRIPEVPQTGRRIRRIDR